MTGDTRSESERADDLLNSLSAGRSVKARQRNRRLIHEAMRKLAWEAGYIGWRTAKESKVQP
jgi:hypothetical protein